MKKVVRAQELCYNTLMVKCIQATDVKTPKWPGVRALGWLLAAVTLAVILLQIVTLVPLSKGIGQLIDIEASAATWLIGVFVFIQVFSLPFLMGMKVTPGMRLASMMFGWISAAVLSAMTLSGSIESHVYGDMSNLIILGTPYSIWLAAKAILFAAGIIIVSVGWWPLDTGKKKKPTSVSKAGAAKKKKPVVKKPAKKTKK